MNSHAGLSPTVHLHPPSLRLCSSTCLSAACLLRPPPPRYVRSGTSLLLWALGLRPSKDGFWSSPPPPHSHRGPNPGSNCELNALVAVLSQGVVGAGDAPDRVDRALVARAHRADGRLLHPDRPIATLNAQYLEAAFPHAAAALGRGRLGGGELWGTTATVSGATHHLLLALRVPGSFYLRPDDVEPALLPGTEYVTYWWHALQGCGAGAAFLRSGCGERFGSRTDLRPPAQPRAEGPPGPPGGSGDPADGPRAAARAPPAGAGDVAFGLRVVSPVHRSGWCVLGEVAKYVPMSPVRVAAVRYGTAAEGAARAAGGPAGAAGASEGAAEGEGVEVEVVGVSGEAVTVAVLEPVAGEADWCVRRRTVAIGPEGRARAVFRSARGTGGIG